MRKSKTEKEEIDRRKIMGEKVEKERGKGGKEGWKVEKEG